MNNLSQLKLEHWLCGTFVFIFCHFRRCGTVLVGSTILLAFWKRMHYFIGKLEDKDPFNWLLEREGTILRIDFVLNNSSCWLDFHLMDNANLEG